jgi:hypothetical protein
MQEHVMYCEGAVCAPGAVAIFHVAAQSLMQRYCAYSTCQSLLHHLETSAPCLGSNVSSSYLTQYQITKCLSHVLPAAQLASGEVFGKNQPVALQLLGSNRSFEALEGVAMELEDSLYPLLREVRKCLAFLLLVYLLLAMWSDLHAQ